MASPVGHGLMGVAVYFGTVRSTGWMQKPGWLALTVLFSAGVDLDYLPALFVRHDIAEAMHRTVTHTLLFGFLLAGLFVCIAGIVSRRLMIFNGFILFLSWTCHLVMDIFTEDTLKPIGVALFHPFSDIYLYSPLSIFMRISKGDYSSIVSIHNVRVALYETGLLTLIISAVIALRLIAERRSRDA